MSGKKKHEVNIIRTTLFGSTWYQAECKTCKWLAPTSRPFKGQASNDFEEHAKP